LLYIQGHHRYALAFYELGQLDSAIRINTMGQGLCAKSQDYTNVLALREQGEKYLHGEVYVGLLTLLIIHDIEFLYAPATLLGRIDLPLSR